MTLVVALRCREGAVIAADGQLTFFAPGARRVTRKKPVTKLRHTRGIAWAWSGDEEAQQRFWIEIFERSSVAASQERALVREQLEAACRTSLGAIDSDAAALDLLIGWWSAQSTRALLFKVSGVGERLRSTFVDERSNVEMIGSPDAIRFAEHGLQTLGFGDFRDVGMEEAKIVAAKVIADVAVRADDVGDPAHIVAITQAGRGGTRHPGRGSCRVLGGRLDREPASDARAGDHARADDHQGHRPQAAGVRR